MKKKFGEAIPLSDEGAKISTQLRDTTMNNRLAERSRDFLSALARLEEALAQPEDSFLRDASIQRYIACAI